MEILEVLAVLLIVFNVVLLGGIWYLIVRLEGVVENIKEEEQVFTPKTTKDILEKNKNLEILKNNYNKINKATNKHNLDEVIEQETKELNAMILDYSVRNPQEIIKLLKELE